MQADSEKLYAKFPEPYRTGNFRGSFVVPFFQGAKVIQRKSWELLSVRLGLTKESPFGFLFNCLDQNGKSEKVLWPSSRCRPHDSSQLYQNIRKISYHPFLALSRSSFVTSSVCVWLNFSSDKSKWHFNFYSMIYCHSGFNLWKNNWKEREI